jgi:serine/threonine protein kinase
MALADPFGELGDEWSRPWKIARVLEKLAMDVPDRLSQKRVAALVARLKEKEIEATLADGSPLDARPPSIDAKLRLRRARRVLFSKYQVLQQVGRSHAGMSEGFKVRDTDGSIFFLKIVPVAGALADALRRELDAYAKLQRASGEHLLQVYGSERSDEHLGLLTEFADGGTLYDHVTARSVLTQTDTKAIAQEVCTGLRELHEAGIIHRDLKPANVLRAAGAWKLGDFGISKNLARLVTQGRTFQGYGTPDFAPPEQLAGAEAHPSADVYAFGKMVAFLLTGTTDVDKIVQLGWQQLARRCTLVTADARPSLAEVADELARL